ncbi:MAG: membrane dipeptidase [bacterium]|nr:membrane dipeptidase [bacterium]
MDPTQLDALIADRPVFDAHVDSLQRSLDLGHDLGVEGPGHLDLVRGARGGLGAVVLVAWVEPVFLAPERGGARARTYALLGEFEQLLARHPDAVRWAGNGADLDAAREAGCIAGIAGIEGGHSIEESLEHLEQFFAHGVRVMTLVWNNHLSWIRSCQDGAGPDVPLGLSPFGREVVGTMNRLGMLVDLSHASERAFYDALEVSSAPMIASHSGCSRLHDHPRNLDDDQLRALGETGGVVGMVFCTPFLDAEARAEENRLRESAEFRALPGNGTTERWLAQAEFLQREARPLPLGRLLDHACHAIEMCGIEHVGVGSDYDGIQRCPQGLEDASCYPRLAAGLLGRGYALEDVRKVLGGNMERVFRAATGPGTRAASAERVAL